MKNIHTTKKPWGEFTQFSLNEKSTVKTLKVEVSGKLSLQTHKHRSERWYVLEGNPEITQGENVFTAAPGQEIYIELGQKHRISAPTNRVVILEIAYGEFDEEDIIRLEDKYNR